MQRLKTLTTGFGKIFRGEARQSQQLRPSIQTGDPDNESLPAAPKCGEHDMTLFANSSPTIPIFGWTFYCRIRSDRYFSRPQDCRGQVGVRQRAEKTPHLLPRYLSQ